MNMPENLSLVMFLMIASVLKNGNYSMKTPIPVLKKELQINRKTQKILLAIENRKVAATC